ncbi:MAG: PaREP1 family protein [bacterium]|nr:PaREP1 family protein [bacterium]
MALKKGADMKTLTYRDAAWELLDQAVEEVEAGDGRLASEKGWGAAAQMVKAVAESRGRPHDTHTSLFRVIDSVVEETDDDWIYDDFMIANSLRQNFYENQMASPNVVQGLEYVTRLLKRLDAPDVWGGGV